MKPRQQHKGRRKPHRAAWLYSSLLSNFIQVQTYPQSFRLHFLYITHAPHLNAPSLPSLDIQQWNKQKMFRNQHLKAGQNWHKWPFRIQTRSKKWIYTNNPPRPASDRHSAVLAPYWSRDSWCHITWFWFM